MFNSHFEIIPMQPEHIEQVLEIIESHDDDDAEEAQEEFEEKGLAGYYVLSLGKQVIAISGYRHAPHTNGSYWLGWTYVKEGFRRKGHGRKILDYVINQCKKEGCRKLWVSTSDYQDDDGMDIYLPAKETYKNIGFSHSLTLKNYFDQGESKHIYHMHVNPFTKGSKVSFSNNIFGLNGVHEIAETTDAYTFDFFLDETGVGLDVETLKHAIIDARSNGANRMYVGLPSDALGAIRMLESAGFEQAGCLEDYFDAGVSEINFIINL